MVKFTCETKNIDEPKKPLFNILQGIIYDDGSVEIGPDVWRKLDRVDYPSYEVYSFRNLAQARREYFIVSSDEQTVMHGNYKKRTVLSRKISDTAAPLYFDLPVH